MNAGETGSSETVYFEPARFFGRFGFRVSTISANISPSALVPCKRTSRLVRLRQQRLLRAAVPREDRAFVIAGA
jgi:hypothetical protein